MKLKITDVRQVIGELISETWSPHDVDRPWRFPTDEEKMRIEREFGMRLRWDAILGSQKYDSFQEKWGKPRYGRIQSLLYYTVGISVKDVHSTLDEGYGITLVAIAYDSPFGKPSEYWVVGYGPKSEMLEVEKAVLNTLNKFKHSEVSGGDRVNDWLKTNNFQMNTGQIIYKHVIDEARRANIIVIANAHGGVYRIQFSDPEHMEYAVRKAEPQIKVNIHKDDPDMKVQIKANHVLRSSSMEFEVFIYNKYTNHLLGVMTFPNLNILVSKND